MKTRVPDLNGRSTRARVAGFTLTEVLVASAVFTLVVSGIVFANLFGLGMFRITATTLDTTDDVRRIVGKMANEIQTCSSVWIGNITNGVFTQVADGNTQRGNGVLIYSGGSTSTFVIYYVNPTDRTFRRTTNVPGSTTVLASSVTNKLAFTAQDLSGQPLTNNWRSRALIHLNLEFYQPRRHRQISDYYKIETSVTRRTVKKL